MAIWPDVTARFGINKIAGPNLVDDDWPVLAESTVQVSFRLRLVGWNHTFELASETGSRILYVPGL